MTIDERGNVVWTRESDDHRLYYVNNNGVWSDDYVSVSDRSILDDLTKTEAKVDGGAKVSSHTSKTGINDIFKVFKFASDKTKVEWAVHRNGDTYTIGTDQRNVINDVRQNGYITRKSYVYFPNSSRLYIIMLHLLDPLGVTKVFISEH